MESAWHVALKKWNASNPSWCVPRRGTKEYNEVVALMGGLKPKRAKKEPGEPRKARAKKAPVEGAEKKARKTRSDKGKPRAKKAEPAPAEPAPKPVRTFRKPMAMVDNAPGAIVGNAPSAVAPLVAKPRRIFRKALAPVEAVAPVEPAPKLRKIFRKKAE